MITFPAPWKWQLAVAGSLVLAAASACKDDQDGPQPVDPDAPQSYGHCGDALTDCMPAPESFGGCSEFYSEYDLLEMKPIGPWWTVCVPECAADSDCPIPNTGSAGPKCRIDGDIGSCELPCGANMECPDGMECPNDCGVCMWPHAP